MDYRTTPGKLQLGDFSLYFERSGSGPALVFLHGAGGNHLSWWQQVPFFMRWYECVTVDQRGFGLSPDTDGSFNSSHPSDLATLLEHLAIKQAVLVGQSMGGWTIVGYALEHPERVAGLVMADTHGGIATPEVARHFPPRAAPTPLRGTAPIGSLPTYAKDYFARRPERAFLYDELRILGAQPPADALQRIGARRYELDAVRKKLTMPVLCMVGEEDVLIVPEVIKGLSRMLPRARLVTVPDCGHSIYFERPEVFNQALLEFLREIGYAGAGT